MEQAYRKTCRTLQQAEKERAILQMLQTSSLRHLTPKLTGALEDPLVIEMLCIDGSMPDPEKIGRDFLDQLGVALRQIRRLCPCEVFGAFDARLRIPNRFVRFGDFLETSVEKWALRLNVASDSYLRSYSDKIRREFEPLRSYFDSCMPICCHGDMKPENLIIRDGNLVGVVDWEHAGAYCLEWELRKFPCILPYGWQWERLLEVCSDAQSSDERMIPAILFLNAADLMGFLYWCRVRGLSREEQVTMERMHNYLRP